MKELFRNARIAKDTNFDGQFLFGVQTTGIFCRPSCPAPVAKEENARYFSTIFETLDQGFRPCLRCRPDISSEYVNGKAPTKKEIIALAEQWRPYKTYATLCLWNLGQEQNEQ